MLLTIEPEWQESALKNWLKEDEWRLAVMKTVARLNLPQGCVAAGFVRNLIWDRLHGYKRATPLDDIDVIYYAPDNMDSARDLEYEEQLKQMLPARWSVKNQARMHRRNHHAPYRSIEDAMRHWVEVETAIGAYWEERAVESISMNGMPDRGNARRCGIATAQPLRDHVVGKDHIAGKDAKDDIHLVAPFGLAANFGGTITFNTEAPNREAFQERRIKKHWQQLWPGLTVRSS